jgi:YVTN family beta-propeller protein
MKGFAILGIVSLLCLAGCGTAPPATIRQNPVPTVATISPIIVIAGAPAFTLTVNGANFVAASTVNFGGTSAPTTFVSSTQLTATIPSAAIASAGSAIVTVTNPAPGGGTSNGLDFTISPVAFNPVPTVTTISPNTVTAEGAAFTLTVNGTNFIPTSFVIFGGNAVTTTFVSSTQLTAAIPPAAIFSAGTASVMVGNPTPGGGTSNSVNFTITPAPPNPIPVITSFIAQFCAPPDGGAFNLFVNGSGFGSNSVVQWNGSALPTTFEGAFLFNGLQVVGAPVPASDLAVTGSPVLAAITVFNPPPGGGTSNTLNFTITTAGVGPQSIAVDPTGSFAYVADNGCPDNFVGNVTTYTINGTTGALTAVPPNLSADFGPKSVAVAPSGKWVYVTNDGAIEVTGGSIFVYALDPTTGTLTLTGSGVLFGTPDCHSCVTPYSLAVHPSGKFAYVALEGGLFPTFISMFSIDATTGAFTSIGAISAEGRAEAVTVDPTGNFAYVANRIDPGGVPGNVAAFSINSTTGALTPMGTISAGIDPTSLAVDPTGKFVYVTNSGTNDVFTYTINTTTGVLTSVGQISTGINPSFVAVDPTGKFAYVTNSGSNDVSMYTIDATTGALTGIGTIATDSSPTSIAIHPSGKFVYVTNFGSNSVSMYSINATTGALTLIGTIGT